MQEEEQIGLEATSYLAGIADQLCMYYGGSTIWTANSGQIIQDFLKTEHTSTEALTKLEKPNICSDADKIVMFF